MKRWNWILGTHRLRDKGWSYQTVADYLNAAGVTTDGGAIWYPTTIRRALPPAHR